MSQKMLRQLTLLKISLLFSFSTFAGRGVSSKAAGNSCSRALCARPPIVLVPGFEGSLFQHSRKSRTREFGSSTIFLAPVTDESASVICKQLALDYQVKADRYRSHFDLKVIGNEGGVSTTEYPQATCAPSSCIAHCVPVPAVGPINRLAQKLSADYGYVNDVSLFGAPYDWRLPPHQLRGQPDRAADSSWTHTLERLISGAVFSTAEKVPALIFAHGYGCVLVSQFLATTSDEWRQSHVSRLWCVSAPLGGTAVAAMELLSGFSWHNSPRTLQSFANARVEGRLDFRSMEFELGLRRTRRQPLPHVAGVWDDQLDSTGAWRLVGPTTECSSVKRGFGSLIAMLPNKFRQLSSADQFKISTSGGQAFDANDGAMERVAAEILRDPTLAKHMDAVFRNRLKANTSKVQSTTKDAPAAPRVQVHCVFGSNVSTPGALQFGCTDLRCPPSIHMVSGDGLVEDLNADICEKWADMQEQQVVVERKANVQHFDLLSLSSSLFAYLDALNIGGLQTSAEDMCVRTGSNIDDSNS